MKIKLLFILFTALFVGCKVVKKTNSEEANADGKEIKFEVLLNHRQSAVTKAEELVITNQKDFEKEWKRIFSNLDFDLEKPSIDFNEKNLAVICLGEISKGGHDLTVEKITQKGITLNWALTHSSPGKNCMSIMVIEQPVWFVSFEKGNYEKYNFKILNKVVDCE